MKISGSQTIPKGKINEEIISSGSTKVIGDIECEGFKSSGSLKGTGNITVHGNFKCSGSFKLEGAIIVNGNAKSSGSTKITNGMQIKGILDKSGSFTVGNDIEAVAGMKIAGSSKIDGNLMSKKDVELRGAATINGNIKAENVTIGMTLEPRPWKSYKIYGNIIADNEVEVKKTFVKGDIKGRKVIIGRGSEVAGEVYYIESIEVHPRTTVAKKPVKIKK